MATPTDENFNDYKQAERKALEILREMKAVSAKKTDIELALRSDAAAKRWNASTAGLAEDWRTWLLTPDPRSAGVIPSTKGSL